MAKIDESNYKIVYFNEQESLLRVFWLSSTYGMSEQVFKEELNNYLSYVKKLRPRFVLVNSSEFEFELNPKVQKWVQEHISPQDSSIYEKIAYVKPDDFHAERALTQYHKEQDQDHHEIKYFMHEADAKQWLLKGD